MHVRDKPEETTPDSSSRSLRPWKNNRGAENPRRTIHSVDIWGTVYKREGERERENSGANRMTN